MSVLVVWTDLWVTEDLISFNAPTCRPSSLGTGSRNKLSRRDVERKCHRQLLHLEGHVQVRLRFTLGLTMSFAYRNGDPDCHWRRAPLSFHCFRAVPFRLGRIFVRTPSDDSYGRYGVLRHLCGTDYAESSSLMFAGPWHPKSLCHVVSVRQEREIELEIVGTCSPLPGTTSTC